MPPADARKKSGHAKRRTTNDACATSTKSRIDKLGIRDGHDVLLLGIEDDAAFMSELRERGARTRTSGRQPAAVIVATFHHRDDLRRLAPLVPRLQADGMLWTLRPKGSKDLTEQEMMRAAAGQRTGRAFRSHTSGRSTTPSIHGCTSRTAHGCWMSAAALGERRCWRHNAGRRSLV